MICIFSRPYPPEPCLEGRSSPVLFHPEHTLVCGGWWELGGGLLQEAEAWCFSRADSDDETCFKHIHLHFFLFIFCVALRVLYPGRIIAQDAMTLGELKKVRVEVRRETLWKKKFGQFSIFVWVHLTSCTRRWMCNLVRLIRGAIEVD